MDGRCGDTLFAVYLSLAIGCPHYGVISSAVCGEWTSENFLVGPSQGLNIYHAAIDRHPTNPGAEIGQKSGFRSLFFACLCLRNASWSSTLDFWRRTDAGATEPWHAPAWSVVVASLKLRPSRRGHRAGQAPAQKQIALVKPGEKCEKQLECYEC